MRPLLWVGSTKEKWMPGPNGLASEAAGGAVGVAQFASGCGWQHGRVGAHGVFAVFDELVVGDNFESSIVVLDQGGEGFDPIAAVEVVHVAELFVGRGVNVPANDAAVVVLAGQLLELFLILIDKSNRRFDLGFHPTAEGAVG